LGLYRVYDLARREGARWSGGTPPAAEHAGPLLTAIAAEAAEVLERTGIQPYEPAHGEPYDPVRHRPVETVEVTENSLHGAVVQVLNCGFTRGETIARRADVVVGQPAGDELARQSRKKAAGQGARGASQPVQEAAAEPDAPAVHNVNGVARGRDND
ncbi:MAG: nucleotide exchange factor GrpE, partial [Micromonosporaceae bacterium]